MGTKFIEGKKYIVILSIGQQQKVVLGVCERRYTTTKHIQVPGANSVLQFQQMMDIRFGRNIIQGVEVGLDDKGNEITAGSVAIDSDVGYMSDIV